MYERLVKGERLELRGDLAGSHALKAATLLNLGRSAEALPLARNALGVLHEEVARTGRSDLDAVLRWAKEALKDLL